MRQVNEVYQWGHGSPLPTRVPFTLKQQTQSVSGNNSSSSKVTSDWQVYAEERVNIIQVTAAKYHNAALSDSGQVRVCT